MAWKIEFSDSAKKALNKLEKPVVRRILKFLDERVKKDPRSVGDFLKGPLSDFWKYRIGDYRLICSIEDEKLMVMVVRVGNRKDVYRDK